MRLPSRHALAILISHEGAVVCGGTPMPITPALRRLLVTVLVLLLVLLGVGSILVLFLGNAEIVFGGVLVASGLLCLVFSVMSGTTVGEFTGISQPAVTARGGSVMPPVLQRMGRDVSRDMPARRREGAGAWAAWATAGATLLGLGFLAQLFVIATLLTLVVAVALIAVSLFTTRGARSAAAKP